jgi:hypothetical protein
VQETQEKAEEVRWAPNPWFDVDISEVFLPFDKVNEMGHLFDLAMNDFVDIESQPQTNHSSNTDVPSNSMLGVNHDEDHREDEDLHIVLKIPTPRHAH